MKKTVNCDELIEMIPAYSIGATDEDETRLIENALPDCPELAAELAMYRSLEPHLALRAPQVQPPAELLDNLLVAARQTRRAPRRSRLWWYAAAACLVMAIVANNLFWFVRASDADQRAQRAGMVETLYLPTAANGSATAASAQVIWLPDSPHGVILASNFPAQQEDTVYQAWVTRGGQITSLGTFQVNDQGVGALLFPSDRLHDAFDALGVTLEPGEGSSQPTSLPVVRWQQT